MEPLLRPVTVIERAPGRFTITGEIDHATAPRLDELEDVHGPLQLDLHSVTFMDSGGIAALVRFYERCPHPHCTFQIDACSLPVERVLRTVGLYELLTAPGAGFNTTGDGHRTDLQPSTPEMELGAAASD